MAKEWYRGVSGVARKVTTPYRGVGGVARKVTKGYRGVSGVARQFFAAGTPIANLSVGDSVYVNESGSPVEYIIVQKGIPSMDAYSYSWPTIVSDCYATTDGVWLMRKDVYPTSVLYCAKDASKYAVYSSSNLRSFLQNDVFAVYDSDVQAAIKSVKLPCWYFTANEEEYPGKIVPVNNKVFALSIWEMNISVPGTGVEFSGEKDDGSMSTEPSYEGVPLEYFLTDTENRAAANDKYWTRSAVGEGTPQRAFCIIGVGATYCYGTATGTGRYTRPVFVLPHETIIDDDRLVIGI